MRIKLKHVNKVTTKRGIYYYHRPTGVRLRSEFGSQAFIDELAALNRKIEHEERQAATGTLSALIMAYKLSPEFAALAPRTRRDYDIVMGWLKPIHEMAIILIDAPFMISLRDRAFKQKKRNFANYVVSFMSMIFNWGIPRGFISTNPVSSVPKIRRPRDAAPANRPWMAYELKAVLDTANESIRTAVALGAYAALREGDILRLHVSAYDGDSINVTHRKTGVTLSIPVLQDLKEILDKAKQAAAERAGSSNLFIVNSHGREYTGDGFRSVFFKLIRKLKEDGKVGKNLTFHGLRHTAATMLADAGCDTRDIMSITGHKTEGMVTRYTQKADQRRRATGAILKLENERTKD